MIWGGGTVRLLDFETSIGGSSGRGLRYCIITLVHRILLLWQRRSTSMLA